MRQAEGGHLLHGISVKGCAKTPFKVWLIKSMPSASSYVMRNALCTLHYSGVEDVMLNCFMQWPRERQDQRAKQERPPTSTVDRYGAMLSLNS